MKKKRDAVHGVSVHHYKLAVFQFTRPSEGECDETTGSRGSVEEN